MKNKKILLTGVTGQDGSLMTDYLLENTDYEIWGMVRRTAKPDWSNLSKALKNPRFKIIVGDLSDSQSIDNAVKTILPDYFINFAAQSFVGSSWTIPEQTFDICAIGVIRCLEAIKKYVPHCRFYSAGSSEQFGDVQYTPQDEKHPMRARSPYGAAKIAAAQITKVYRESYNLYALHGILFNHESERRGEEFVTRKITLGVARINHAIMNNLPFEPVLLGNLDAKRDWSHAEDFIVGIWKMLNQETPQEYVLSSNETHTVREFVEKAFLAAGYVGDWKQINGEENFIIFNPVNGQDSLVVSTDPKLHRPAEVSLLHGDSSRARKELNWQPMNDFNKLVKRMVYNDIKNYTSN